MTADPPSLGSPAAAPARLRCLCWPDYSTPDAPSLELNDDCPQHGGHVAAPYDGPAPY